MLGLAGADHGRPGFGNDSDRRESHPLKDLPVDLPGIFIPSCGAADVEAAVLIFDQVAAAVEFPQNACGKASDVGLHRRICQESALEAELSLHSVRTVAGLFSDQDLPALRRGIGSDKAFRAADFQHLRHSLVFFVKSGDRALRVPQVKTEKAIHALPPLPHGIFAAASPFFRRRPSETRAGRIVPLSAAGSRSNSSSFSGLHSTASTPFL